MEEIMVSWFKRVSNPRVKIMDDFVKKRGLLLVEAKLFSSSVYIENVEKFVNFAKRSKAGTVFKSDNGKRYVKYFYIANGVIVRTSLLRKVKLSQTRLEKPWRERKKWISEGNKLAILYYKKEKKEEEKHE